MVATALADLTTQSEEGEIFMKSVQKLPVTDISEYEYGCKG